MEFTKGEDGVDTMKLDTSLFVKFEDYTNGTVHDFVIIPVSMSIDTNISITEHEDGRQELSVTDEIIK